MRLLECLNDSDVSHLRKIALRHTLDCPLYSKNSLLQEITARFFEPSYWKQRQDHLSDEMIAAIQALALDRRDHLAPEEVLAIIKRTGLDRETSLHTVTQLEDEGLLFRRRHQKDDGYHCPQEVWDRIYKLTSEQLMSAIQVYSRDPEGYRDDGLSMARDAYALLGFVRTHEIRLTRSGTIFKRHQQQIISLFQVPEPLLDANVGWRFGYGRRFSDYPDRFALLYDHLYSRGCLAEQEDDQLTVNEEPARAYMSLREEERAEKLVRDYLHLYCAAIPNLRMIAKRIVELTSAKWVYAASLRMALLPFVTSYYYESPEVVLEKRIFAMFEYLGLLQAATSPAGDLLYKATERSCGWLNAKAMDEPSEMEERKPTLFVQGTFDVIVSEESEALLGWDLLQMADRVSQDRMSVYRISRDSIYRACQNGLTADSILQFFYEHSPHPIPDNVRTMIEQWGQAYGKIKVSHATLITCRDEASAHVVKQLPLKEVAAGTWISPLVLAIEDAGRAPIEKTLRRLGYLIQTDS
ncbi:helicase-associated domain-containing protein [Ferroacidibacillus organovorans]|uniref:Helicase XPB/Ssl2 N-terminal domain-containing protein n=1 Tax=Ferroacidibacillus organovorans TaxID=1765683 RepID=A0A101XSU8_9BACL|nr:helicase-associated domain-containing protein [Ferroacidibacillus organovorans]KUO96855.1 hypothetical protein ATW55_08590 [Ferroacidibacillus organovorans]